MQNRPSRYILLQTGDDIPRQGIEWPPVEAVRPAVGVPGMGAAIRVTNTPAFRNRERRKHGYGADCAPARAAAPHCLGFSLLELLMVLVVTALLTGLMMPAMAHVRENARRIVCQSNLRQLGMGVVIYTDEKNTLPFSFYGQPGHNKQHMMAAHRGAVMVGSDQNDGGMGSNNASIAFENWEGLGWLHQGRFIKSAEVLYCPSHHGEHSYERYLDLYQHYRQFDAVASEGSCHEPKKILFY